MRAAFALLLLLAIAGAAPAAELELPGLSVDIGDQPGGTDLALALKLLVGLTILALAPSLLVVMTSFVRIILVLSILRHALGMQQTPPNVVLVSLALFLTLFSMMPVIEQVNEVAWQPYSQGTLETQRALELGVGPLKEFMLRQTREEDLALMFELAGKPMPGTVEEVTLPTLMPAFMLSELATAFQIGFVIFVPFLLVDIIVSSLLMSLGMLMMPPMMISLPIKVLMFVLIDGWNLVVRSLVASFH
jgi:flagellar biosynthesis protein FliP